MSERPGRTGSSALPWSDDRVVLPPAMVPRVLDACRVPVEGSEGTGS